MLQIGVNFENPVKPTKNVQGIRIHEENEYAYTVREVATWAEDSKQETGKVSNNLVQEQYKAEIISVVPHSYENHLSFHRFSLHEVYLVDFSQK